jgi:hypothetical protein
MIFRSKRYDLPLLQPLNRSRRRKEAEGVAVQKNPPRYLGGYNASVHADGKSKFQE